MNTTNVSQGSNDPLTGTPTKLPKRLHGRVVYDRVRRDVYALARLVDVYLARRRPDDEDPLTKEVFDALLDAEVILCELQGLVDAVESRIYPLRRDVFAEARALKVAKAADRNPPTEVREPIRYRVDAHLARQGEAS